MAGSPTGAPSAASGNTPIMFVWRFDEFDELAGDQQRLGADYAYRRRIARLKRGW